MYKKLLVHLALSMAVQLCSLLIPSGTLNADYTVTLDPCRNAKTANERWFWRCGGEKKPVSGCSDERGISLNLKWLHTNSSQSKNSALSRNHILRAISVSLPGDIDKIREFYKEGQRHNANASSLIDDCDDNSVSRLAYEFAENVVRLRSCSGAVVAASATCGDFTENLRWAVLDSGNCAPYARYWLSRAMSEAEYDKVRAEWVRRALQAAQGHDPSVAISADFISDKLLLKLAAQVYSRYSVGDLDRRYGNPANPFARQNCPGIMFFNKYE